MLTGKSICLRPVLEKDLDLLYSFHIDIKNRACFFPRGILSQTAFCKLFQDSGFWDSGRGMLLINQKNEILGHVEWFKTVAYLDEIELSYHVYDSKHRAKGFATEAVNLLIRYLFENKPTNRIRLMIHPENVASKRLVEACGFKCEGISRGAWFHQGTHHDVEVFALLRCDMAFKRKD